MDKATLQHIPLPGRIITKLARWAGVDLCGVIKYLDRHSTVPYARLEVIYLERNISPDLIRGHTDTIILRLLCEGDMYGYQIYRKIIQRSLGMYELKEATLYSSLRRLENQSLITSYWGDESQGGRRRYYRITDEGRRAYGRNRADWEFTKKVIDMLI